MFPTAKERYLRSELNVTQRHQSENDRNYDVDGGHDRLLPKRALIEDGEEDSLRHWL